MKPPKVAIAQAAKKAAKKAAPRTIRAPRLTGLSGSSGFPYWNERFTMSFDFTSALMTRLNLSTRTAKSVKSWCSFA